MNVNKKRLGFILLSLMIGAAVFAGGQKDTEEPIDKALLQESTTIELNENVVAVVNGEEITAFEFNDKVNKMIENFNAQGRPIPEEQMETFKKQLLDGMVSQMALLDKCDLLGIEADPNMVAQQYEGFKGQFPTPEDYQTALTAYGVTEEELKTEIEVTIRIQALISSEVASKVADVTEEEALEFYNNNPAEFKQQERVRASHILLKVEQDASDADKAAALQKAEDVLVKAKAGEDFASLAVEFSEGPSGPRGGDLNYFVRGQMVPQFDAAVFSMEIGDVSEIVETQFGYHIIKLTDKVPEGKVDFEEYKTQIQQGMKQQKTQVAVEAYIQQVMEEAEVTISM